MRKKLSFTGSVILAVTLIYALATGAYFTCMYQSVNYFDNPDSLFAGYFYLFNVIGILGVSFYMKDHYTNFRMLLSYSVSIISVLLLSLVLFLPLSKACFTLILVLIFILTGATQACYVFLLTIYIPKKNRCISLAIAATFSIIINSLFSLINNGAFVSSCYSIILYLILAILSCICLCFTLYRLGSAPDRKSSNVNNSSPSLTPKIFIYACLFIAFSWIIQSLGFYFPYNSTLIIGLSSEVLRITNIAGLLIAGYLNSRDKRIGAILSLIILASPMLYIFLQAQSGPTLFVFLLSYFLTGFLSIYRFGIIADMSDSIDSNGKSLTYLCTFGLLFGHMGEGIGALLGIHLSDDVLLLQSVTNFVLVIGVAIFIFHYISSFVPTPNIIRTHEDKMTQFKINHSLSSREIEVLEFLIDDNSNSEIADKLFISENTVKFHVSNLLKKTNCKSRKELSALFYSETNHI